MPTQPAVATRMIAAVDNLIRVEADRKVREAIAGLPAPVEMGAVLGLLTDAQITIDMLNGQVIYLSGLASRLQDRIDMLEATESKLAGKTCPELWTDQPGATPSESELDQARSRSTEAAKKYKVGDAVQVWWRDLKEREGGTVSQISADIIYGTLDSGAEFMRAADVCIARVVPLEDSSLNVEDVPSPDEER